MFLVHIYHYNLVIRLLQTFISIWSSIIKETARCHWNVSYEVTNNQNIAQMDTTYITAAAVVWAFHSHFYLILNTTHFNINMIQQWRIWTNKRKTIYRLLEKRFLSTTVLDFMVFIHHVLSTQIICMSNSHLVIKFIHYLCSSMENTIKVSCNKYGPKPTGPFLWVLFNPWSL
jgi:hypothetical protein